MKKRPRPLRRYPDEALTAENIRGMLLQAAQRGAHQGFQTIERERLEAKKQVEAERGH